MDLTQAQFISLAHLEGASAPLDGRIGRGLCTLGLARKVNGQWKLTPPGRDVLRQIQTVPIRKNGAWDDLQSAWEAWRSAGSATQRALTSAQEEAKRLPEQVKQQAVMSAQRTKEKLDASAQRAKTRLEEELTYQKHASTWKLQLAEQQTYLNGFVAARDVVAQGGDLRHLNDAIAGMQATVDSLTARLRRKNPAKKPMHVQTLLFARTHFTRAQAVKWLKKHNYETQFEEAGANYWRFRQREPSHFEILRTIPFGNRSVNGIYAVVGRQ